MLRSHALRALCGLAALVVLAVITAAAAGWRSPTFLVVEAVAIAAAFAGNRLIMPGLDRREQGNLGEIKVASTLEALAGEGWRVLHDVPTGRGNVDHIVVGPGGLLTVETKSRRGRIGVATVDPRWLRQAYAQKKWLERITGEPVDALLVFSDAWLDRMVSRQRGVCVLPARALPRHLARRPRRLSPQQVESIYARLARALSA